LNAQCPSCGGAATRCTDTMDTFVDSSWYYARYVDPHNAHAAVDPSLARTKLPVDLYVGGIEHAVLHLLYARFVGYFLHDLGLVPTGEPFKRLLTQGMVHGRTLTCALTGRALRPEEVRVNKCKITTSVPHHHCHHPR
jgi:leucyl-tRNA synthetase